MQTRQEIVQRLALALCLITLVAAAAVSTRVFERLPHTEDELAFLFQARTLAEGRLWAPAPPEGSAFDAPFLVTRDGKWFGKYTPGYPLLLASGVLAGQPWLVNPLLAGLSVGLIYLLGRAAYGAGTGLLAAALATASPFMLLQAGSLMGHVACLFWSLLFTVMFLRARDTGRRRLALAAGISMGMLFLSRPLTAVGIGLPFALWALVDIVRAMARRRGRTEPGEAPVLYAAMLAGFVPFVLALLAYNQATTGNALLFAYQIYWPYDRLGFGEGIGIDGLHTLELARLNTRLNVEALQQYLFGWPGGRSLALAGLGVLGTALGLAAYAVRVRRGGRAGSGAESRSRKAWQADILLALVPLSLALVHMVYWNVGQMYGPRYYFEALGALVLLSARGMLFLAGVLAGVPAGVLRRAVPRAAGGARAVSIVLVLAVVAGLFVAGYRGWAPQTFRSYVGWYEIDGRGLAAVRQADVHNAIVFVQTGLWTDYAAFFSQNLPTLDGDIVYAQDRGPDANAELLDRYPGRSLYYWDGESLGGY